MTWYEPEETWTYASRALFPARAILLWIVMLPAIASGIVLTAVVDGAWVSVPIALALIGVWWTWLLYRQVTAHAWAEREDDLIVKRGRAYRSVTVVPYGRMQYVEVEAGPLARAFGIARIQLHTASPGTDAQLCGVLAADAETLRDRLTARGESRLAGL